MLATQQLPITMSSLELVSFINSQRKEGESELRHSDFLEKVVKVIGEEMSGKFRSSYRDSMNREKPCYNFPKREACLMAMSYSYELQAKVFDRMTELESKQVAITPMSQDPAIRAMEVSMKALEWAKSFGFVGNQAVLSANKATLAITNMDLLALSGNTHLLAEKKALTFTPTQLGKQFEPHVSPHGINMRLEEAGLQVKVGDRWSPTEKGLKHCEVVDTGKKHSSGTPVKQIKWYDTALEELHYD